jgi:uncharacterized protein YjiS (DUF1127 family)
MYFFAPDRRRPWWRRLLQSLARQGRALAAERRRRLAIRRLREFDPRMLADIGLRRSEIEPAVPPEPAPRSSVTGSPDTRSDRVVRMRTSNSRTK